MQSNLIIEAKKLSLYFYFYFDLLATYFLTKSQLSKQNTYVHMQG